MISSIGPLGGPQDSLTGDLVMLCYIPKPGTRAQYSGLATVVAAEDMWAAHRCAGRLRRDQSVLYRAGFSH